MRNFSATTGATLKAEYFLGKGPKYKKFRPES